MVAVLSMVVMLLLSELSLPPLVLKDYAGYAGCAELETAESKSNKRRRIVNLKFFIFTFDAVILLIIYSAMCEKYQSCNYF